MKIFFPFFLISLINEVREFLSLLWDCHNNYFAIRKNLLKEIITKNILILVGTQQLQILVC